MLNEDLEYNRKIQPVCFPTIDISTSIPRHRYVIGFGITEKNQLSPKLLEIEINPISHDECISRDEQFFSKNLFDTNYCAVGTETQTACKGELYNQGARASKTISKICLYFQVIPALEVLKKMTVKHFICKELFRSPRLPKALWSATQVPQLYSPMSTSTRSGSRKLLEKSNKITENKFDDFLSKPSSKVI